MNKSNELGVVSVSDKLVGYRYFKRLAVIALFTLLAACAGTPERNPLPAALVLEAQIAGIPQARFWADEWPDYSERMMDEFTDADFRREFAGIYDKPHSYLAISGGGANGAVGGRCRCRPGWQQT